SCSFALHSCDCCVVNSSSVLNRFTVCFIPFELYICLRLRCFIELLDSWLYHKHVKLWIIASLDKQYTQSGFYSIRAYVPYLKIYLILILFTPQHSMYLISVTILSLFQYFNCFVSPNF